MNDLHPRNWTILCWLLFLLWLAFSVLTNFPFAISRPPDHFFETNNSGPGVRLSTVSSIEQHIGWPFTYCRVAYTNATAPATTRLNLPAVFVNIPLVAIALLSLVYSMQRWMKQFSIRSLFIAITVFALILTAGIAVFTTKDVLPIYSFMLAIYFFPIAAVLMMSLRSLFVRSYGIAD